MNNAKHAAAATLAALALAIATGCQSTPGKPQPASGNPGVQASDVRQPMPADWPRDIRNQPMFDGASGLPITWQDLVATAANADAVIIGEMHSHEQGLAVAAALFDDILARKPNTASLAMEFFERDEQNALDDYLTGITDEDAFRKAAARTDGNYPPGHRAMVEAAKIANRPVIAANAPRRYVRIARTEGYDKLAALTLIQRALFVIPQSLTTGPYRDRFYGLMGGMAAGHSEDGSEPADVEAMVLPFYRSQNMWDATMADSIARAINQGDTPVVHVVGQFHCDHDGGLVTRLRTLRPRAKVLVVSMSGEWSRQLTDDDNNRADVVVYVGE